MCIYIYIYINVLSSFSSTSWLPPFLLFLISPEICQASKPRHSLVPSKTKQIELDSNNNINYNNNITTKPRTISLVNKNQIYSTYPMFIFLNKLSEDTASIFKFTPLTLWHKNDCKIFDISLISEMTVSGLNQKKMFEML